MLSRRQLEDAARCTIIDCAECSMYCINTIETTRRCGRAALAYRGMLERARKTLQDAWDDDGSATVGKQILETIKAIDALLGKMLEKAKIKHLKPGTVFNAGPVAVRVLEHFPDGKTLVITDKCIADRPFTCQPFKPNLPEDWKENNWRTSTLRADLNRDFLNSFDETGGPILSENIIPAEWDLTDSAGNNDYGSVTDKIGLLTEAMFRKYSEQGLLKLNDWWWLITPTAGYSYYARYVNTDGTLHNSYAYNGYRGVRPALFVESEIEVDLSPNA